jgi:hypothetical protein
MAEKPKGAATNLPDRNNVGEVKGSVTKPPPQTPRDSIQPPPSATPDTNTGNQTPQAS